MEAPLHGGAAAGSEPEWEEDERDVRYLCRGPKAVTLVVLAACAAVATWELLALRRSSGESAESSAAPVALFSWFSSMRSGHEAGSSHPAFFIDEKVEVPQVRGPPASAVVVDNLGAGMYRVQYIRDHEEETVSAARLSFGASDQRKGGFAKTHSEHRDGAEDVAASREHRVQKGGRLTISTADVALVPASVGFYVVVVLCSLAVLALASVCAYFAYQYKFPKRPLREGAYVKVTYQFTSENKNPTTLRRGDRGQVIRLRKDAALVNFYAYYDDQWVVHRNFPYLEVSDYGPVPGPRLAC